MELFVSWGRGYWVPVKNKPGAYRPSWFRTRKVEHLDGVDYEVTLGLLTLTLRTK